MVGALSFFLKYKLLYVVFQPAFVRINVMFGSIRNLTVYIEDVYIYAYKNKEM